MIGLNINHKTFFKLILFNNIVTCTFLTKRLTHYMTKTIMVFICSCWILGFVNTKYIK